MLYFHQVCSWWIWWISDGLNSWSVWTSCWFLDAIRTHEMREGMHGYCHTWEKYHCNWWDSEGTRGLGHGMHFPPPPFANLMKVTSALDLLLAISYVWLQVECYSEGEGWQLADLKSIGKRCFFSAVVVWACVSLDGIQQLSCLLRFGCWLYLNWTALFFRCKKTELIVVRMQWELCIAFSSEV